MKFNEFVQLKSTTDEVETILNSLSLEEKIGQLNQLGKSDEEGHARNIELAKKGLLGSVLNYWDPVKIDELQQAARNSKNGIPIIVGHDVIHGNRTIFPIPLADACSWDMKAVEKAAELAADEASLNGIRWTFAPMVDVSREQRWGRVMEGAGEDAYLGSAIARVRVRGFQHEDENGNPTVVACAKHFAGYGFSEAGRDYTGIEISERTLREYVLPPFKAAVDEGVATLMAAFSDINGIPASGNEYLCQNILRDEWGFEGFVISDWESVSEMTNHGFADSYKQAAEIGINSGVDMDMYSEVYIRNLASLVEEGKVDIEKINESVRRILRVKLWLGLFENSAVDAEKYWEFVRNPEHLAKARELARGSFVLLKNENQVLPITNRKYKKIALIGPIANEPWTLIGNWHNFGKFEDVCSIVDAVNERASQDDIEVEFAAGCPYKAGDEKSVFYKKKFSIEKIDETLLQQMIDEAVEIAKKSDVAIVCVGEGMDLSGENCSRTDISIPEHHLRLLKAVKATGKPMVMVLSNGRAVSIPWEKENCDAILDIWHPGTEAGYAVADVLFGDYNPGGKLVVTFPRSVGQIPIYYNHKNGGRPSVVRYLDDSISPLYPFGYGLSYTKFEYSGAGIILGDDVVSIANKDAVLYQQENVAATGIKKVADYIIENPINISDLEQYKISVDVKNVGEYDGSEVVQLYVTDVAASVTRPVKQLCGFKKVFIEAGEKVTVTFDFEKTMFEMLDREFNTVIESGTFVLHIGTNSDELTSIMFNVQ